MFRVMWLVAAVGLTACGGKGGGGGDDTGDTSDDSGGGGGVTWRPSGEGYAYFIDGAGENSVFRLDLTRVTAPDDGQAYYGWLSGDAASPISLGEIAVDGDTVTFEHEIGTNAFTSGYTAFSAVQAAAGSPTDTGDPVWAGAIEPELLANLQELLLGSSATRDGSGLVRGLDHELVTIADYATEASKAQLAIEVYNDRGEAVYNALTGEQADVDNDGDKQEMEDAGPIAGEAGLVEAVYAGLDAISARVPVGDPIKDFANYAYDCTRRVADHVDYAAASAGVAAVCASESTCQRAFTNVVYDVDLARTGQDADEDGTIDYATEGTVDCALYYVGQMARMEVAVP